MLDDAQNAVASARGKRDSDAARGRQGAVDARRPARFGERNAAGATSSRRRSLAQAKLDLEHATVRAPVDGAIGKTDLRPGEFLTVGQSAMPLIASGQAMGRRELQGNRPDYKSMSGRKRRFRSIRIRGARGRRRCRRSVRRPAPSFGAAGAERDRQLDKIVQRIPVRLVIEPTAGAPTLRPGMSAEVEIVYRRAEHALQPLVRAEAGGSGGAGCCRALIRRPQHPTAPSSQRTLDPAL